MNTLINTLIRNGLDTICGVTKFENSNEAYELALAGNINSNININFDDDLEFDSIDYDTAEFIPDLTPKNESKISIKHNLAFESINITKEVEGKILLVNKNGVELKELNCGENSIHHFPIGIYYIVVMDGYIINAVTPFYCIK